MKVGDYIRIDGYISKIEHIKTSSSSKTYAQWKQPNGMLASANIIIIDEFSPNIIDLIEVGDILSFKDKSICRVLEITDNGYYLLKDFGGEQYYESKEYINELKSIVTREVFSSVEYRVESN